MCKDHITFFFTPFQLKKIMHGTSLGLILVTLGPTAGFSLQFTSGIISIDLWIESIY
jgi:hypothetical protein